MKASLVGILLSKLRYMPVAVIYAYKGLLSPILPPSCRFYPTCSTYALDAFRKYGLLRGGVLALTRVLKCHPFHPGGFDPLS